MKNIKLIALIALMLGGMTMKAQEYHPIAEDGKQWNVLFSYPWSPPEPPHRYTNIYKIEGDTLLDGISYKVMYTTRNEDLTGWNCWGFIRETEDGQVFSRRSSSSDERMMYDFSMQVGDTIFMYEEYMTVIETSEVFVGDEPRQQIVLEYPFGGTETWIEGIGSLYGIIDSGSQFLVGGSTDLLCYYENGDLIWQNTSLSINSCYFVYSGGGQQSGLVVTPTVLTFDEPAVPQTFTISNQFDNDVTITSIYVQPDDSIVLVSHANLPQTLQPNESMTVEVELNAIGNKGYNSYHIYMLTSEGAKVVVVRVNENVWNDYVPLVHEGNDRQKWNVVYIGANENYPNDYFTEIQSIRDNINLDGVDYKLVWKEDVYDSKRIAGAVREEDKRVYYRMYWQQSYQDEVLLYDFNLTVGDTISVGWTDYRLIVLEESQVQVNGTMRRQLGLAIYFDDGTTGEIEEYWIEGVGSTYGFLNSGYEGWVGAFVHLLCYHENGNLVWDNEEFDDCVMNSDGEPASFAPHGAEWYFNVFSFMNSPTTYYRMAVEGDTLIQRHQCSVITRQYLGGNGDKQYVYEENNKVYWYNATLDAFTTLYDFDAEEGESWICHIDSCSYEVTVQSVEQVTWGGRTYRVQNITSVEGEFYERIIEGIGSVRGLFPYPYACVGDIYCGPEPDYLRCYLVDGEMLYHEGDLECDAVLPWQYPCWDGTVAEAYDGGNGTAEDPYQIATPQQLALLAQQTNDGTGGDAYYLLTDDICLNASLEMWTFNWRPIGRVTDSTVAYFSGHFDGNGKTISKLLCETNEMMTDPVIGLFGCTDGAEIVNVNLSDCRLTGGEYAGGLVGYAGSTDISNCSVQNSNVTTTGGVAGGIVGYAGMPFRVHETNENVSKITNCEIEFVTVESSVDAGGIVGKVNDESYYARYLISNCNANNEQYFHVKGSVSGGIVGEMRYGTVKGCASKTIVLGTGQVSNVCVGGIAGSIHGSTVIANSYNRGNVVADFEFAGGIVGYSAGNVYNVYNAGEVVAQDPNSSGFGTIVGNVQAGERLNCYWLENELPSAGNPILPDMPGSTSFHQGTTSTSWVLDEAQYGTTDLLEALNHGPHDDFIWIEDVNMTNGGLPIPRHSEPGFPLQGSEWYYEILNDDGSITYQYLYQAGDTVVQDEPTHILVKINTLYNKGSHQEVTHEYVFERDGKLYWWNKTLEEFTVLYDLGAQPGDSWVIKVGTETLTMHVDAVEQYEYEGRTYKTMQVSDEGDFFSGTIVCGVGHLSSFFPERLMTRGKGYRVHGLRCYWSFGDLHFTINRDDCDAIYADLHNGIEEDDPSTGSGTAGALTVYPNPTNGILFVETRFIASQPTEYRISNLMGQTILSGNITAETQQIEVSALPKGMYFITFAGETRKFVIR